uniref:Uncharacterized protein n=1 Tax=Avena sativa TaxID=4498 RepID=A0ACD5V1E8_AVESA
MQLPPLTENTPSTQMAAAPNGDCAGQKRRSTFHPSLWGDYFLTYQPPLSAQQPQMQERAGLLKEQVRAMIKDATETEKILDLIITLERLGLDFHYDDDISQALDVVFKADYDDSTDLHLVSLRFYLLRKHRYDVSSDVFRKFQDKEGNFVNSDTKSLLSLYNAAHLRTHGEDVLDEAISFTTRCLQGTLLLEHLDSPLMEEVSSALVTPLFRRVGILEARKHITCYGKEATRNEAIFELAKLDFTLLQLQFCEELEEVTLWWKKLYDKSDLTFVRDRIVEIYFWMNGGSFKPQYSFARIIVTKITAFITIIDDIYDTYGTTEESMQLAEAIYRWDESAIALLPDYMKDFYLYLLEAYDSFENDLGPEKSYRVFYLKEAMKQLVRAYSEEIKWRDGKYVPTVSEHLKVSMISIGNVMVACALFVGMDDIPTVETYKWVLSDSELINSFGIFVRLTNDIVSTKREQTGDHIASTVQSYMKEHGTTRKVAREKLRELAEDSWKTMLKLCLAPTELPVVVPQMILDLAKASDNMYKYNDAFTTSGTLKDTIRKLYVNPIE